MKIPKKKINERGTRKQVLDRLIERLLLVGDDHLPTSASSGPGAPPKYATIFWSARSSKPITPGVCAGAIESCADRFSGCAFLDEATKRAPDGDDIIDAFHRDSKAISRSQVALTDSDTCFKGARSRNELRAPSRSCWQCRRSLSRRWSRRSPS
jgi:hypothetical protein